MAAIDESHGQGWGERMTPSDGDDPDLRTGDGVFFALVAVLALGALRILHWI